MLPTIPADRFDAHAASASDDGPRFFLDDAIDAAADGEWWLDLGRVDLPGFPGV